jgi:hypothetical protein
MRSELDALINQMHKGGILYTEAVWETANPRTGHPPEDASLLGPSRSFSVS